MTAGPEEEDEDEVDPKPLRRHGPATRLAMALGVVAVVGLMVLALAGFTPAFYLMVVAIVGFLMIVVGARLH